MENQKYDLAYLSQEETTQIKRVGIDRIHSIIPSFI